MFCPQNRWRPTSFKLYNIYKNKICILEKSATYIVFRSGGTYGDGWDLCKNVASLKGGLISESFSLWLNSTKKLPNHDSEHLLFR